MPAQDTNQSPKEQETRVREFRQAVHLVGAGEVLSRLRMHLGMYHTVTVDQSDTLAELRNHLQVSAPDCVAALVSNHHWARELLDLVGHRPSAAIVMLVPKLTPKLIKMLRMVRCQYTYGRRGLAMRGTSLVAQSLELPPRVSPKVALALPPNVVLGQSTFEGKLLDLASHAAILRLACNASELAEQRGKLNLKPANAPVLEIGGGFELWQPPKDGQVDGFFRFGPMDPERRKNMHQLIWNGTEKVLSGQRNQKTNGQVRSAKRTRPDGTFKARVNPLGKSQQFYFKVENIGRSGVLLSSTGAFDAGLAVGAKVGLRIICPRGPVEVLGSVTRVLPRGVDPQRPKYHGIAVEFDKKGPTDLNTIDTLLRYMGLDGVI